MIPWPKSVACGVESSRVEDEFLLHSTAP
jgi:hypothetical protein